MHAAATALHQEVQLHHEFHLACLLGRLTRRSLLDVVKQSNRLLRSLLRINITIRPPSKRSLRSRGLTDACSTELTRWIPSSEGALQQRDIAFTVGRACEQGGKESPGLC